MGITIKKIASDLKLAVSTVSKALGDSYEISAETKKRVLDYAHKVNYVPNTYASSLKNRKTRNIAVIVPEVADSYFSNVINGIDSVARVKGFHVMIYITHEDQQREQSVLGEFKSGRVDGVLMSASPGKSQPTHIQDLETANVPLVMFDRVYEDIQGSKVVTDDFDASFKATSLLIKKSCERIAFLAHTENLSIVHERVSGFQHALAAHNRSLKTNPVVACGLDELSNYALIKKLLRRKNHPDGLVCCTEKLSTLSYKICHELELDIPESVKVIGFTSMPEASLLHPPLTTVTQPAFEMGKAAAMILFRKLETSRPIPPERIVISSQIFERKSTG